MVTKKRIKEIRNHIINNHSKCVTKYIGAISKDFGEIFCCHIHSMKMHFIALAIHFDITMEELAELTADHIRRFK